MAPQMAIGEEDVGVAGTIHAAVINPVMLRQLIVVMNVTSVMITATCLVAIILNVFLLAIRLS